MNHKLFLLRSMIKEEINLSVNYRKLWKRLQLFIFHSKSDLNIDNKREKHHDC